MLNIGAGELIIILVVALLVLGPTRLPDVATGIGKAIREFRKATRDITAQLEIDDSVSKPFQELRSALQDLPAPPPPLPKVSPPEHAPVPVGSNLDKDPHHDELGHPIEPQPVPVPVAVPQPSPVAVAVPQPVPVAAQAPAPAAPSEPAKV